MVLLVARVPLAGRSSYGTWRQPLERIRPRRQPGRRVRLVNQHVAATAGIDRLLHRVRVARDDDTAI